MNDFHIAEKLLEFADEKRNHGVMLLYLIDKGDFDINIRVAGAIAFKNYVKRNWAPNEVNRNTSTYFSVCAYIINYEICF